ncbi:MAG: hypothetical protein IKU24_04260 [Clostridia bacterium]|nr:hypothetical protein [Clostridia bacterium]
MFQAGFARVDVTPPLGTPLAGYAVERFANGVLDPLELNCVVFSDGETKAALITADFLYVMENAATPIRKMISEKCDIPMENVFMQGLHQHTSVRIGCIPNSPYVGVEDEAYLDVLYRKYCDVVTLALLDMKDASLEMAEKEAEPKFSFIRRYYLKDGSLQTNPFKHLDKIDRPAYQSDNMVRVLRLKREGAKDIAIVNFSCHPDVIGGKKFSADWCGFVRRHTEKTLPDVHCVLVNGAQGDSNHIDFMTYKEGTPYSNYAISEKMGKGISDVAVSIWNETKPMETGKIWGKVVMKYVPTNTRGIERFQECAELAQRIRDGEEVTLPEGLTRSQVLSVEALKDGYLFQKVPVSVLCLGKLGFVGFGGEPFTHYATKAREAGKDMYIVTACLTNGGQGYLPTAQAFSEGGYETSSSSRYTPVVEEIITGAAAKLLEEYRNIK